MFTLRHCPGFVSALLVFSPFYVTLYSYIGIARVVPPTAVCFLSAFSCLPDWLAPPRFLAAPGGLNGNQTGREGSPSAHDLILFLVPGSEIPAFSSSDKIKAIASALLETMPSFLTLFSTPIRDRRV